MGDGKPNFTGTWKLVKSENFEDFLAANGLNWFIRKMASKASVTAEIVHDGGDQFEIKTTTPMRTQVDKFTVGEPYETETMGGAKMKVTPSWDGDGILLTSECIEEGKGKPYTNKREIVNGQLLLTMTIDDVVCKRWFDKA